MPPKKISRVGDKFVAEEFRNNNDADVNFQNNLQRLFREGVMKEGTPSPEPKSVLTKEALEAAKALLAANGIPWEREASPAEHWLKKMLDADNELKIAQDEDDFQKRLAVARQKDLQRAKNDEYSIFKRDLDMKMNLKRPNGEACPIEDVTSSELVEALRISFNTLVPSELRRHGLVGGPWYAGEPRNLNPTKEKMLQILFKELAGRDDMEEGQLHLVAYMADVCRRSF